MAKGLQKLVNSKKAPLKHKQKELEYLISINNIERRLFFPSSFIHTGPSDSKSYISP